MGYLTNTSLEDKDRCKYAAEKSGMNVEFRDHPIPKDYSDPDDEFYRPQELEGAYGSVYTNEGFVDHSKFWRAWDEYIG
jgi:hypothetical protein